MIKHICQICGKEFTGRKKKYCSQECLDEARRIKNRERWREDNSIKLTTKVCIDCGQVFETYRETNVRCSECASEHNQSKIGEEHTKVCVVCGVVFTTTKSRIICCSEECGEERHKETKREWETANYEPIPPRIVECKQCGKEFETSIKEQYCSSKCKEISAKQRYKVKKHTEWITMSYKVCEVCGEQFKSWNKAQTTCSSKCSTVYNKRMDRSRKYNVKIIDKDISLKKLYKRDDGVCHLCGEQCNYKDYKKDGETFIVGPSYPSIDHVVPRSKGGVHSWNNIKLAHHYCNSIKNNNESIDDTSIEYQRLMA